ncbi:MAG: RNA polymerase sigma factor RpoD/SigA [Verrucomicrobia bacterium]|nr:RNA polymerase sigma factor RpoD/SigA [Verrucomicrobiota bacterium]
MSNRDAFELYIREIGQTPLLSLDAEDALARRVQEGDADARERMIKANLRLVVKIAREYEGLGVPLLDLISEGNMGLMKGVERFDPDKGAKLSTYASWWIKQNIRRAIANQSKTVRLPAHVVEKRVQIREVEGRLQDLLGRTPTDAEVASELGLEAGWVRHYRQALVAPSSLDAPLGSDDDSGVLGDVVADPSATNPYDDARLQADSELVNEVLNTLNQRERDILRLRFGLTGDEERSLEEIGAQFGLTRERIRQIQERALYKLRLRIEERDAGTLCA